MKKLSLTLAFSGVLLTAGHAALAETGQRSPVQEPRQRLFVLTDIENEPDDTQSLVRLLLYANKFDIEGIVATTSVHMKNATHPESIRAVIKQYGKVRANLLKHESGYPSVDQLLSKVSESASLYGMAGVGDGKDSPGSNMLLRAIKADDHRPLWVTAWGGSNALAQALHRLKQTTSAAQLDQLLSRVRVYTISDQDDSGAWIRKNFPSLMYIVSPGGYGNASWLGMSQIVEGIDNTTISNKWLAAHIQQGQGPLGAAYPDVAWAMEGDTPSFLGLIPNGLNAPDHPDWGGWGGRYVLRTPALDEIDPTGFNGGVPVEAETRPIWTNASDTVAPYAPMEYDRFSNFSRPRPASVTGPKVTIWRWRADVQNDFAARMRWTTQSYANANHPPKPALAHPDHLTAYAGSPIMLDATGTSDPDGDSMSYQWFQYVEAGTLQKAIEFGAENTIRTTVMAPEVDRPETVHFILRVTDKGTPALSRYKRVIVRILPRNSDSAK
jgi:DNA-dependent RNA polymerase auxiliary subunit epsilon